MSIAAAENAGLGPCELPLPDQWITHTESHLTQDKIIDALLQHQQQQQQQQQQTSLQSQTKIMNAVAPAVACPPAAIKKIRRKPENKPQSQINKCNNEKRRRELENEFIEQLGEFLQINKQDVTSCKPDKAAILNAVVKKFKSILGVQQGSRDKNSRCTKCPPDCADTCTAHPIQQGEVSSTEPPLPEPSVNGHSPEKWAYFEAVEHFISSTGWVLLEISAEGIIECVTENIKDLVRFTRNELHSQSIYSYLHPGDHGKLSPILHNMSFALGWDQGDDRTTRKRQQKFRIRLLVKPPEGASETMEQKQQRQEKYEEAVLIAAPVNDNCDDTSSVLCLITRPDDDSIEGNIQPQKLEQLTFKIEPTGKIITFDVSALRPMYANNVAKESGRLVQDLCHRSDLHIIQSHIKEAMQSNGPIPSVPFRLRLGGPDVYVHVKAQSRLFRYQTETDFIMIVNTVLTDAEVAALESHMNNTTNLSGLPSSSHPHGMSGSMGGPLMTSVMNGSLPQPTTNRTNHVVTSFSSPPPSDSNNFFQSDSFDFGFEMDTVHGVSWDSRPDSRTSVTPGSTPRPPSVSGYSPAANVCPSPLTPYHTTNNQGQPSPQNNNNNNNNNSTNNNLNNSFNTNFPFPNFDDNKNDSKLQEQIQNQQQQQQQLPQQQHSDSERLRNLLTKRSPGSGRLDANRGSGPIDNKNNMLLQLLNNKSDDDDSDQRTNRAQSELLRQLQKVDDTPKDSNANQLDNAELIQRLRVQPSDFNNRGGRKRSSNEPDEGGAAKRNDDKPSKLCEQNKMLASLLKNPAKAPPVAVPSVDIKIIPDITNSLISRVSSTTAQQQQRQHMQSQQQQQSQPQLNNNNSSINNNNNPKQPIQQQNMNQGRINQIRKQQMQQQHQQQQQPQQPSDVYLNNNQPVQSNDLKTKQNMMHPPTQRQHNIFQQIQDAGQFVAPTTSAPTTPSSQASTMSQPPAELDAELSEILNDVIDIVPEYNYGEADLNNILGTLDSTANTVPVQSQHDYSETMAINMIQKSLMQFETTNIYNNSPPAYPSPSISMHGGMVTQQQQNQNNQAGFPPPPTYAHRPMRVQMNNSNLNLTQQQAIRYNQQQQRDRIQKQQRDRLLQQQQNQQMVVPVNATAGADQLCLNPGLTNMESLLNNSVAPPNVSLQRSNSVTSDSQLSPGFSQSLIQQQLSPNTRAPFSPQQNYQQTPFNTNTGQRLSPQQQQQLASMQQGPNSNNNPQLSPRQPPFSQGPQTPQPNQNQQWNPSANTRLTLQQQQNPMLNAQLTQNVYNARQFQTQRQRTLHSPGAQQVSRQNSFPGQDNNFPGPPSPTQAGYGTGNVFNSQQLRIQRQASIPQATQHLPGSPRQFGPEPTGYGMMYSNMSHTPGTPGEFYSRSQTGGNNNLNSSEFVRQEIRAVVSARSQQTGGIRTPQSPLGMGQGPMVGNNSNPNNGLNIGGGPQQQQQQQQQNQSQMPGTSLLNTPPDPTSLGFSFDITQTGSAVVETKISTPQWSSGETASASRISSEEMRPGDPKNSSLLLQKLLLEGNVCK